MKKFFNIHKLDSNLTSDKIKQLVTLYQDAFKDWPYYEKFSEHEILRGLEELYQRDYAGFIALSDEKVVGFVWGFFLDETSQSIIECIENYNPNENTFYIAELVVDSMYRRQQIATNLLIKLEEVIKQSANRTIIRTNSDNPVIKLYEGLGFSIEPYESFVESTRVDGSRTKDRRVWLSKWYE